MKNCPFCASDRVSTSRADVDARDFGLPSGTIRNALVTICDDCGEESTSLPAQGAVISAYRTALATVARPLTGDEYAFLRRALGVTGRRYAEMIGTTNVTVSRLENGAGVPAAHDALIRAVTMLDVAGHNPIDKFERRELGDVVVDVAAIQRDNFIDLSDGWQVLKEEPYPRDRVVSLKMYRDQRATNDHCFESVMDDEPTGELFPTVACR